MAVALWILVSVLALLAVAAVVFFSVRSSGVPKLPVDRAEGPRSLSAEPTEYEMRRQQAVDALGILDTMPEDRFDRIVTMARQLYGTESAVFSVIDREREWHKSRSGNTVPETARVASFCSVTIRGRDALVVGDASLDDRFSSVASVVGDPNIRFYAGFPVRAPGGQQIGALCVYDPKPRDAAEVDDSMLRKLAGLIEAELRVSADLR